MTREQARRRRETRVAEAVRPHLGGADAASYAAQLIESVDLVPLPTERDVRSVLAELAPDGDLGAWRK